MSSTQAGRLNYEKQIDSNLTLHRLDYSHPNFEFSTSNIKDDSKDKLRNTPSVALEAPLLRLKFGFYSIITTSIAQLSILPAALWLLVETLYLLLTVYSILRYRYVKNWAVAISRFNTSLALLFLSLLTFALAVDQTGNKNTKMLPSVPEIPQFLGILAVMVCLFVEVIILIPKIGINFVYFLRKKMRKTDAKEKAASQKIIYAWFKKEVPKDAKEDAKNEKLNISEKRLSKKMMEEENKDV